MKHFKNVNAFQYVIGSHLEFGILIQIGKSCSDTSIALLEYSCLGNRSYGNKNIISTLAKQQQVFIAYVRDALFRAISEVENISTPDCE